ncbi:hypothetical protein EXU30_17930 [Shewanella maritima]|uniref:Lipoprotein n=2 Tax=Shewanella maritima TaxID=2520507 RepID=A0A411PLB5_9GAMM|nr:hypothetical protein EXU30_17930 [Shewanella maritima]
MMLRQSLIVIALASLCACSASPVDPQEFAGRYKDRFSTQIKGKDIKLFTYRASLATSSQRGIDDDLPHNQRISRKKQDASSYRREQARKQEMLEAWGEHVEVGLVKTLAMTGYCQTGYIELSRYVTSDRAEIRGECNEGATEADIEKFGR